MKQKLFTLSVLCLFGIGQTRIHAQTSVNSTGGNASGSGGTVSYSVGQVYYTTQTGTNGTVTQGVQQPYEISVITFLEEAKGITLWFSSYPNPTTGFLTLEVKDIDISNIQFQLYNINGILLQSEIITGNLTQIDMSNLVPATYFVKIFQGEKEVKTLKIIKK